MLFSILYRYQYLHNFLSGKVFFTLSVANSLEDGARGRNRTGTVFPPRDFKSLASTNFATRANFRWASKQWRLRSESNRRTRSCSPLHDHSATQPLLISNYLTHTNGYTEVG